ncbi:TPA: DUF5623 domain-containing protein [Pseudomonas aeruginosa]|nr:hypothetical protein [Pseudomonas aeruginosa]MCS9469846.1 hypothetical protein [Pseudomonas aeruginosa]MCS9480478.1 hypothetical protein [Pseudomonas aeruginosa]HCF3703376.1 DUF5623 domain-containing protein [Pseudomonas aeruginosa]HCF3760467.1 DUF5623 domain-containing protein [Pseudomonas aeruginosa]
MSSYSSRLDRHLKNQARKLKQAGGLSNQQALDRVATDFGFTAWKQACEHMDWADAKIRECVQSLPQEIAKHAVQLRAMVGYPYAVDDRIGIRYMPAETLHVDSIAKRLVYLGLYEQVHAPEQLNRTENAKLWFRAVLPLEDAEDQKSIGQMKLQSLAITLADPAAPRAFPRERGPLTPEVARTRVLAYLHALHSISVIRCLVDRPEAVLDHPCFKAFAGYALTGLQANPRLGDSHRLVISFAGISEWAQPAPAQFDSQKLCWVDAPPQTPEPPVGTFAPLSALMQQGLRPTNALPQDQHHQLSGGLQAMEQLFPEMPSLRKRLEDIRATLASWLAAESGSADVASDVYFASTKHLRARAFLAPAEERRLLKLFQNVRGRIEEGYAQCVPRSVLLGRLKSLELALGRWLERTRLHWKKANLKVQMDSIGLVATDPKHDVLLEEESNWRRSEPMGTSWEGSLVSSVRAHLFKYWREEDEAEGYPFDESSEDSEESLVEHLHGLAFYRYIGKASTPAGFMRDVRKAFYFGVEHAWFKQKLLRE